MSDISINFRNQDKTFVGGIDAFRDTLKGVENTKHKGYVRLQYDKNNQMKLEKINNKIDIFIGARSYVKPQDNRVLRETFAKVLLQDMKYMSSTAASNILYKVIGKRADQDSMKNMSLEEISAERLSRKDVKAALAEFDENFNTSVGRSSILNHFLSSLRKELGLSHELVSDKALVRDYLRLDERELNLDDFTKVDADGQLLKSEGEFRKCLSKLESVRNSAVTMRKLEVLTEQKAMKCLEAGSKTLSTTFSKEEKVLLQGALLQLSNDPTFGNGYNPANNVHLSSERTILLELFVEHYVPLFVQEGATALKMSAADPEKAKDDATLKRELLGLPKLLEAYDTFLKEASAYMDSVEKENYGSELRSYYSDQKTSYISLAMKGRLQLELWEKAKVPKADRNEFIETFSKLTDNFQREALLQAFTVKHIEKSFGLLKDKVEMQPESTNALINKEVVKTVISAQIQYGAKAQLGEGSSGIAIGDFVADMLAYDLPLITNKMLYGMPDNLSRLANTLSNVINQTIRDCQHNVVAKTFKLDYLVVKQFMESTAEGYARFRDEDATSIAKAAKKGFQAQVKQIAKQAGLDKERTNMLLERFDDDVYDRCFNAASDKFFADAGNFNGRMLNADEYENLTDDARERMGDLFQKELTGAIQDIYQEINEMRALKKNDLKLEAKTAPADVADKFMEKTTAHLRNYMLELFEEAMTGQKGDLFQMQTYGDLSKSERKALANDIADEVMGRLADTMATIRKDFMSRTDYKKVNADEYCERVVVRDISPNGLHSTIGNVLAERLLNCQKWARDEALIEPVIDQVRKDLKEWKDSNGEQYLSTADITRFRKHIQAQAEEDYLKHPYLYGRTSISNETRSNFAKTYSEFFTKKIDVMREKYPQYREAVEKELESLKAEIDKIDLTDADTVYDAKLWIKGELEKHVLTNPERMDVKQVKAQVRAMIGACVKQCEADRLQAKQEREEAYNACYYHLENLLDTEVDKLPGLGASEKEIEFIKNEIYPIARERLREQLEHVKYTRKEVIEDPEKAIAFLKEKFARSLDALTLTYSGERLENEDFIKDLARNAGLAAHYRDERYAPVIKEAIVKWASTDDAKEIISDARMAFVRSQFAQHSITEDPYVNDDDTSLEAQLKFDAKAIDTYGKYEKAYTKLQDDVMFHLSLMGAEITIDLMNETGVPRAKELFNNIVEFHESQMPVDPQDTVMVELMDDVRSNALELFNEHIGGLYMEVVDSAKEGKTAKPVPMDKILDFSFFEKLRSTVNEKCSKIIFDRMVEKMLPKMQEELVKDYPDLFLSKEEMLGKVEFHTQSQQDRIAVKMINVRTMEDIVRDAVSRGFEQVITDAKELEDILAAPQELEKLLMERFGIYKGLVLDSCQTRLQAFDEMEKMRLPTTQSRESRELRKDIVKRAVVQCLGDLWNTPFPEKFARKHDIPRVLKDLVTLFSSSGTFDKFTNEYRGRVLSKISEGIDVVPRFETRAQLRDEIVAIYVKKIDKYLHNTPDVGPRIIMLAEEAARINNAAKKA